SRGQVVMPTLKGKDPAVEEFLWAYKLPAEVVNEEDSSVSLDMQGGLVKVRLGVVPKIEHPEVQLAAGDYDRPPHAHPARIDGAGVQETANRRLIILDPVRSRVVGRVMN